MTYRALSQEVINVQNDMGQLPYLQGEQKWDEALGMIEVIEARLIAIKDECQVRAKNMKGKHTG